MAFKHAPVVKLADVLRRPSRRIRPDGSDLAVRIAQAAYWPNTYAKNRQSSLAKRGLSSVEPWREMTALLEESRLGFPTDDDPQRLLGWLRTALRVRGLDAKTLLGWYHPKTSYDDFLSTAAEELAARKVALLELVGKKPLLVVLPEAGAKRALLLAGKKLRRVV